MTRLRPRIQVEVVLLAAALNVGTCWCSVDPRRDPGLINTEDSEFTRTRSYGSISSLSRVVSLSTVPERLADGLLEPTIQTLLRQTVVLPIVVAVPWHSKRFPDKSYHVPGWLNNTRGVHVVRCEDWGPSTKLIAALDIVNEGDGIIITVDDDTLYHPRMVENLLRYAALLPDAAIAHAGHRLWGPDLDLENFRSVEFLRPPHHARLHGRSVSEPTKGDMLHSYAGALYRRRFFDEGVKDMYAKLDDVGDAVTHTHAHTHYTDMYAYTHIVLIRAMSP